MSVNLDKKTCDTIGCNAPTTHVLTWHDRDADSEHTESVCETDGMMYTYRPSLRATLAPMASPEPTPAPQSGYTPCACRDCMDVTVSSDIIKPELCSECTDAGCEAYPRGFNNSSSDWECQRDDAYGEC